MYLHNYAGDVLGTDISSVRVIGVSTLFSRHQTGPVHLMWSFWFIFPAAFGCHSYPQAEICPIYVTSKCFSRSFSNHSQTEALSGINFFILSTSIALYGHASKISLVLK